MYKRQPKSKDLVAVLMGEKKKNRTNQWKNKIVNHIVAERVTNLIEERNFSKLVSSGFIRRVKDTDLRIQV